MASGFQLFGHRTPRIDVAYTSQMLAETTPEVSSNLTNKKKWASATGYTIDKILGRASEIVTDGKGRFRASYLGNGTYVTPGVASRTLIRAGTRLLNKSVIRGMDQHFS